MFLLILSEGEVGSIAGGGRYDNLVGMFSKNGQKIPCVGMSLGVERIFTILEDRAKKGLESIKQSPTQIFVAAAGADLLNERIHVANLLWNNGIRAEYTAKRKVKTLDQFSYCEKNLIPFIVVLGPDEMKENKVKIRCTADRSEDTIDLSDLVSFLHKKLDACVNENMASFASLRL